MAEPGMVAVPIEKLRWWRGLIGLAVLCAGVPLLLTLLLNVAVAGGNLGNEFGMSVPLVLTDSAATTVPLILLFALVHWRLRGTRDRQVLVKVGAILWGVVGSIAASVFGSEPGAVFVTFPLVALAGAAASYV